MDDPVITHAAEDAMAAGLDNATELARQIAEEMLAEIRDNQSEFLPRWKVFPRDTMAEFIKRLNKYASPTE